MSVRIKFISLAEPANIDYYILYRSSSEAGTYVDINHITHTGDGISHEYLDVSGTIDNWYKLQTHLDTGETSSLSPAFKAIALNVCNVYGTIITPQGNPISGEDVVIKIAGIETEYDDKLIFKESNYDKEKLCVIDKTLRQRKLDSSGNFSFTGTYAEYDDIELPAIKLYDLCDLFGFRVDFYVSSIAYDNEDYGDVKLQISFDGGVTYYYWNIVTWSLAGINDFLPSSDIETK